MRGSTLLSESLAVFGKELTAELRSRVALNAIGLFGLTTLLSALLWVILFFAATSGLSRVFVKEEDAHTAKTLRLAARPLAVFGGKFLFNLVLLAALYALIVPLYCALMGYSVRGVAALVLLLACGAVALAATSTMVAAIISRASGATTLFAILSVPLVLPLLVMLIQGTRSAASSTEIAAVLPALQGIVSLGGATLIVSVYLFPVVWHD
jgi:heme exporter protein B